MRVNVSLKCRGVYKSLLGDGFLVGFGSSWLVLRFWLVGYPSFMIKLQISKILLELLTLGRLHPQLLNLILRLFIGVLLLFIGYNFSTISYWQVRIFICPPYFLKRGQGKFHGTFQKYYLFHLFLFVGDFSFIRNCRKHECTRLEINRAHLYYLLWIGHYWVLQ